MRRAVLILALGAAACGGTEAPPKVAAPVPALPGPDLPAARCTLLGNGCVDGLDYQMCCVDQVCTFTFSDGTAFATLSEALGYCTAGQPPAGSTPLSPAPGGGYLPEDDDDPSRDGYTPDGEPITGGGGGPGQGAGGGAGGSSGQASSSGGGQCYGSVAACQARNGPSACRENPGCYYEYEGCWGTAWACQSFGSPSGCGYQLGCRWDYTYEQCVGGAASCGSRGSSGSCHSQRGCYWEDAVCSGAAWQCNHYSSESSCQATPGCYWR